jgi:predicted NUDIX family phosphoesterase
MVREALAVKRDDLFADKYFEGFLPHDEHDFISVILDKHDYHERGDALETNEALQQIIPYVWIVNPETKQVFVYKRAADENYTEKRLRDKISCGVGGHIEREDSEDPINGAMVRELMEEVRMENYPEPKIVGYVNDDQGDVEKVHFGIVAIAETNEGVEKGDDEMVEGKFHTVEEFNELLKDESLQFDPWTKISWDFVREYLEKQ